MALAEVVEGPCRDRQDAGPRDGRQEAPQHPGRKQSQPQGQRHPAKSLGSAAVERQLIGRAGRQLVLCRITGAHAQVPQSQHH